jgi:hypothetical protein
MVASQASMLASFFSPTIQSFAIPVVNYQMQRVKLWCLTVLSTIFQLFRGGHIYWWRKLEYLSQVTDNLDHIMLYSVHLSMRGIQTHNVIGDRH